MVAKRTGASRNSPGKSKKPTKPRVKKPTPAVVECPHAWSESILRLAHYPVMSKEGIEAINILVCWRCGAVKAVLEYDEEGKQKWQSG